MFHASVRFVDNLSAENSPLHDIVLQSAPGSPGGSYPNVHADNPHSDGKLIESIKMSGEKKNMSNH